VDGIVSGDHSSLDTLHIQAKRWDGTVERPEIEEFVHALHRKRAREGVFITTGTFSAEGRDYVSHINMRIDLIDGRELAERMIDLNLGVTPSASCAVKRIDPDYFSEE
jgi:restriction system protein